MTARQILTHPQTGIFTNPTPFPGTCQWEHPTGPFTFAECATPTHGGPFCPTHSDTSHPDYDHQFQRADEHHNPHTDYL